MNLVERHSHGAQRMNPNDFCDRLTFPVEPIRTNTDDHVILGKWKIQYHLNHNITDL